MAETKKNMVIQGLLEEAKAENLKENRKKWLRQLREKMNSLKQAKQLVKNCEREIEDLEIQITEEIE